MTRHDDRSVEPARPGVLANLRRMSALLLAGMCLAAGCGSAAGQSTPSAGSAAAPGSAIVGDAVALVCGGASSGGQGCRRHPVRATVVVLRLPSRRRVTTVRTDGRGRFQVDLARGSYQLQAHASGALIWARVVTARVRPHRVTRVTVTFVPRHPLPVAAGAAAG